MNPYKILGVNDQATDEEVKQAYRAMAAKYHPDAGGDAWVFAQVSEAYEKILRGRQTAGSNGQQTPSPTPPPQTQRTNSYSSSDSSNRGQASYHAPSTEPSTAVEPFVKRMIALLFHRQLPLQTETSFFILVNVLDIVFTNVLLRMNAMEANPIARYVFMYWGFQGMIAFKLSLVAFVCLITQLIAVHHLRRARQTLYFGSFVVGCVVLYSAIILARSQLT